MNIQCNTQVGPSWSEHALSELNSASPFFFSSPISAMLICPLYSNLLNSKEFYSVLFLRIIGTDMCTVGLRLSSAPRTQSLPNHHRILVWFFYERKYSINWHRPCRQKTDIFVIFIYSKCFHVFGLNGRPRHSELRSTGPNPRLPLKATNLSPVLASSFFAF